MRKLASIRTVGDVQDIPGADRIQLAFIDGWQCVVKKYEFLPGDLCVYFEIDSILPEGKEWCEFMRDRKFRVKTAKFMKVLSQGLVLPVSVLGGLHAYEGLDVTEYLGVRKHDPEGDRERLEAARSLAGRGPNKPWWAKTYLGGLLWDKMHPRRGGWPEWLRKTDETRIQNLPHLSKMLKGRLMYATEKIDGQSLTVYYNRNLKTGLFSKGAGGVCSRNIHYPTVQANDWWRWTLESKALDKLTAFCKEFNRSLAIQAELIGPGIRDNKYSRSKLEAYVFNVWDIDAQEYVSSIEKGEILDALDIPSVPLMVKKGFDLNYKIQEGDLETIREDLLTDADGMSLFSPAGKGVLREGIVWRDMFDDSFSFKAISNAWLLKYEK